MSSLAYRSVSLIIRKNKLTRLELFVLVVCVFLLCVTAAGQQRHYVPGRLLVKTRTALPETELARRLQLHGARPQRAFRQNRLHVVSVPDAQLESVLASLRTDPEVEFAEPDYLAEATFVPNDPFVTSGSEWHLAKVQALDAWNVTSGNSNIIVAVLDSGVDFAHPDLEGHLLPGYDFVWNDNEPADDYGHGTAVAGTIVAGGNNGIGVAGVAFGCSVLPVKVMDAAGSASHSCIAEGIEYAVNHGARIINLSMGGDDPSSTLQEAINFAWSNNVLVVASAGNTGGTAPQYPAACDHVLAVAATDPTDSRAWFSTYGSFVGLYAPGISIWTTQMDTNNPYAGWNGTSFASPLVAGVAALVLSVAPTLSNVQVAELLRQTADDLGPSGYDSTYSYGRLNAWRAVNAANPDGTTAPPPNEPPPPSPPNDTNQGSVADLGPGPFPAIRGGYVGLVANEQAVTPNNSGYFAMNVTSSGRFTGRLLLAGAHRGFHGQFNLNGEATVSVRRAFQAPLSLTLRVDLTNGTDQVAGSVRDGHWTSALAGNRNVFKPSTNPARQAGDRSFFLERADTQALAASGRSKVNLNGTARVRGTLADGRVFSTTTALAKNGDCPFYLSLNRGNEVVIGWLNFPVGQSPSASGTVVWVREGTNSFAATLQAVGQ